MRSRVSLERYFSLYVSISRDNTFEKDKQCNARADFFLSSLSSKKMKKYRHREENTKNKTTKNENEEERGEKYQTNTQQHSSPLAQKGTKTQGPSVGQKSHGGEREKPFVPAVHKGKEDICLA